VHLLEHRGKTRDDHDRARRTWRAWHVAVALLTFCLQSAPVAAADDDWEPRVARVSYIEGDVSYLNADADEWAAVDVNAPLVTGDRFYAGPGGRAEIELPGGVYARVSEETELDLLEVSDEAVHVRVGLGTATFRLRSVPAGRHVELSTPATALVARARGIYRIDVAGDGQTTVLVRDGELDAYLGDDRYRLADGRGARFAAYAEGDDEGEPIDVFDASYIEPDDWDDWESRRAARIQNAVSYQYVDDDVYGVEDLDEYGDWHRHEEYGPIWRPRRVAAGWAPFTNGRWVWQDPWGWTWVDYEPWGWAPSHYGRWVYVQDYWAWCPGPVVARPVYAPATVGFFGVSVNTPSVSVSVGIGPSIGWVPLGYGEPLIPWWRGVGGVAPGRPWWGGWGGPRIVNNTVIKETNITNINVNNIRYVNFERPHAFTAVDRDSFVRGDLRRLELPRERLRDIARPLRGAPEVVPRRESLFAVRPAKLREGRRLQPPRDALQRAAVTTRAVPAARPAFEKKRQLIEQAKGEPVPPRELRRLARADEPRSQVRTVAARGRRVVVPEVTADAPKQARAPIERRMRPAGDERRDARQVQRGEQPERAAREDRRQQNVERRAGQAPEAREGQGRVSRERRQPLDAPGAAPGTREQMQRGGADTRGAARSERDVRRERAVTPREGAPEPRERAGEARRREAEPGEPRAATPSERRAPSAPERRQVERPQREPSRPDAADAELNTARRVQRDAEQRERVQSERRRREQLERQQRERSERSQRDSAVRRQREDGQRERARVERQQREQVQRVEAERQQREQAQRAQAERRQREQAQRVQAERQQREQAQRAQAERRQREQAQRVQAERRQREQAQRVQAERRQREQAQRAQAERRQRETQQQREAVGRQQQPEQRQSEDPRTARERRDKRRRQPPSDT
jgi:hypothetical protein